MEWQPGDIAACYGRDRTSRWIRWGTASLLQRPRLGPSHVAILSPCHLGTAGALRLGWFESTTMCPTPCLVSGRRVSGVQVQDPQTRVEQYVASGGRVEIYRLTQINQLSRDEQLTLSATLMEFLGEEYDYAGAALSGTRLFQATRLFPGADLNSLFCSELVCAALQRVNRLNHTNPSRYNPARLLRELLWTGKYFLAESIDGRPAGAT